MDISRVWLAVLSGINYVHIVQKSRNKLYVLVTLPPKKTRFTINLKVGDFIIPNINLQMNSEFSQLKIKTTKQSFSPVVISFHDEWAFFTSGTRRQLGVKQKREKNSKWKSNNRAKLTTKYKGNNGSKRREREKPSLSNNGKEKKRDFEDEAAFFVHFQKDGCSCCVSDAQNDLDTVREKCIAWNTSSGKKCPAWIHVHRIKKSKGNVLDTVALLDLVFIKWAHWHVCNVKSVIA